MSVGRSRATQSHAAAVAAVQARAHGSVAVNSLGRVDRHESSRRDAGHTIASESRTRSAKDRVVITSKVLEGGTACVGNWNSIRG